ncbi:MAG TPA: 5'-methylthioadenosine/S-adenosylhomocysteine nucleosidase [Micromonosporaceae bacterium]|nr:5'-methylthioadenosine/S-adenosylhomocysteine nucleosidase [Micromonosporaceae bacterium]
MPGCSTSPATPRAGHADRRPVAVVLTALNVEYDAVRSHLSQSNIYRHPAGTLFEIGCLPGVPAPVAITITGEGNLSAAVLAERAIATFRPRMVLFVGVAGALAHDVQLGDLVVATKIYAYHGGKHADRGVLHRPAVWQPSHALTQLARHVARTVGWTADPAAQATTRPPHVHFRPVAAGEVVLDSRTTSLARQLYRHCNDAAAIEMESAGIACAVQHNPSVPALTIRGISDLADGLKRHADRAGIQAVASARAAAFGFALIVAQARRVSDARSTRPRAGSLARDHNEARDAAS